MRRRKGQNGKRTCSGCDFTILIDYAHSPDALENVLKTVRGFAKGRVVDRVRLRRRQGQNEKGR
jgi:UDP-N-acetylmuramate-alanine ligase